MIPVFVDLPYSMLASLEAAAQSEDIGEIVRAALVAAGYGAPDDIAGVRSDRFATIEERREIVGTARLRPCKPDQIYATPLTEREAGNHTPGAGSCSMF